MVERSAPFSYNEFIERPWGLPDWLREFPENPRAKKKYRAVGKENRTREAGAQFTRGTANNIITSREVFYLK